MSRKKWNYTGGWAINNLPDMPRQHIVLTGSGTPTVLNNPPPGILRGKRQAYIASRGNIVGTEGGAPITIYIPVLALSELFYSTSAYQGTVSIDGTTYTATSTVRSPAQDVILVRHYADGTVAWAADIKSESRIRPRHLPTVDPDTGDVFLLFEIDIVNNADSTDVNVYNSDGTLGGSITSWSAAVAGGGFFCELGLICYDIDGNVKAVKHLKSVQGPNATVTPYFTALAMVIDKDNNRLDLVDGELDAWFRGYGPASFKYGPGDPNEVTQTVGASTNGTSQQPTIFALDLDTLQILSGSYKKTLYHSSYSANTTRPSNVYALFTEEISWYREADIDPSVDLTVVPIRNQHDPNAIYVDVGQTTKLENAGVNGQSYVMVFDRANSNSFVSRVSPKFTDASFTSPAISQALGGMSSLVMNDGDICSAVVDTASRTRLQWRNNSHGYFTEINDCIIPAGINGSVLSILKHNSTGTTRTWQRTIPLGGTANTSHLRQMYEDVADNALYILCGWTHPAATPGFDPEWDGVSNSSLHRQYREVGGSHGAVLIKLNATTGAHVWSTGFYCGSTSNTFADVSSLLLQDDYVHVVVRTRHPSNAGHVLAWSSTLDGPYRPVYHIAGTAGGVHGQNHVFTYTKNRGICVQHDELSDMRAHSTGLLMLGAGLPRKHVGLSVGDDSAIPIINNAQFDVNTIDSCRTGAETTAISLPMHLGNWPNLPSGVGAAINFTGGPPRRGNSDGTYQQLSTNQSDYHTFSPNLSQGCAMLLLFYIDSLASRRTIMDKRAGDTSGWQVSFETDGRVTVNAGSALSSATGAVTTGKWYWLVGYINGSSSQFELSTGTTWSGDVGSDVWNGGVRIGCANVNGTEFFVGRFNHASLTTSMTFAQMKEYAQYWYPTVT